MCLNWTKKTPLGLNWMRNHQFVKIETSASNTLDDKFFNFSLQIPIHYCIQILHVKYFLNSGSFWMSFDHFYENSFYVPLTAPLSIKRHLTFNFIFTSTHLLVRKMPCKWKYYISCSIEITQSIKFNTFLLLLAIAHYRTGF